MPSDPTSHHSPLPYNEEFGRLIDSLLKSAIKFSMAPDVIQASAESQSVAHGLTGDWRPSEATFTPLSICRWQFGDLLACQETDALHGQHIVELKTVQAVDIAMDGGDGLDADAALGAAADVCCDTDVERLGGCLGDYTRQMAVSLMALHVSCMLQFFFWSARPLATP